MKEMAFNDIKRVLCNGMELDSIDFKEAQATLEIKIVTMGDSQIELTCMTFQEQLKMFYALSEAKLTADKNRRPESMLLMEEESKKLKIL